MYDLHISTGLELPRRRLVLFDYHHRQVPTGKLFY